MERMESPRSEWKCFVICICVCLLLCDTRQWKLIFKSCGWLTKLCMIMAKRIFHRLWLAERRSTKIQFLWTCWVYKTAWNAVHVQFPVMMLWTFVLVSVTDSLRAWTYSTVQQFQFYLHWTWQWFIKWHNSRIAIFGFQYVLVS